MRDDRTWNKRLQEAKEALQRIHRGEAPTPEELAAAPRLDFWCVVMAGQLPALAGVVTGHPNLRQGAKIVTSNLLWISDDYHAARTISRFYRLGVPLDEDY